MARLTGHKWCGHRSNFISSFSFLAARLGLALEPFQPGGGRRAGSKHLLGQRQTKGSQQYGPSHVSICARDLSRDETVNSREQRAIC